MRQLDTWIAILTVVLTTGCAGHSEDRRSGTRTPAQEPDPVAAQTKDADAPMTTPKTIPSGEAGVPDIEILEVHKTGEGDPCGVGKSATLKYKAMLADGTVVDPGTRPFTFAVGEGQAIRGWDLTVAQMRIGDSWTVLIPSPLAYGERGHPPTLPPNADMRFDMELVSFQ